MSAGLELDTHDLHLRLQSHFSDGLVVIVGSGLSCAEGLPSMGELASHLEAEIAPHLVGSLPSEWSALLPAIKSLGLEAALLQRAPSSELQAHIVRITADLVRSRETSAIGEVFFGKRVLRFTKLLKHLLRPPGGIPVITTNYDRLIEVACEEADLGVDTMFVGQFAGALNEKESNMSFCRDVMLRGKSVRWKFGDKANVYKPHGSLDWYHREGRPVRFAGDLPATPLIITPGLNKFRGGYDSPFDTHRDRANAAIDRASRFLVIGYGFNDDHLETHLGPMIRGGKPTLLLTRTLSGNASELARQHDNVIALERVEVAGNEATRVICGSVDQNYPGSKMWDLNGFIAEILQS